MVPWWLPVDLPNISANTDCFETWLVSIKRSFQGLSVAIETVKIVEGLMEIWPNEVCDNISFFFWCRKRQVLSHLVIWGLLLYFRWIWAYQYFFALTNAYPIVTQTHVWHTSITMWKHFFYYRHPLEQDNPWGLYSTQYLLLILS